MNHQSRYRPHVEEKVDAVVRGGFRAVILVEGASDENALRTLALRQGRNLRSEGVSIMAMGGATNAGHFLRSLHSHDLTMAGLCDLGEEEAFRRGLERVGVGSELTRAGMESLGFFVCIVDLEDELIRATGPEYVRRVIDLQGESESFSRFQAQPAQRTRSIEQQLRRFMGTRSGRKARYGRALVESMDLASVPRPLELVLHSV
jgi:hypothetical protein